MRSLYEAKALSVGCDETIEAVKSLQDVCSGSSLSFSILQSTEAAEVHKKWLDEKKASYDSKVWALIDRGRNWSEAQHHHAQSHRRRIIEVFEKLFEHYDFVALPAVHQCAPTVAELTPELRAGLLALTSPASLAGLPALTVPIFKDDGLSGGIQIVMPDLSVSRIRSVLEMWG